MTDRCSNCILPANLPSLALDQNGKCNYCRKTESDITEKAAVPLDEMRERFEMMIKRLKGKGKYDCLVPLSGGKESSYILDVLVKEYDMKVLAFNFNNGFQHHDAVRNIENLVDNLGVDLHIYRPSQEMLYRLMCAFLSKAGEFCTPCNMLISATGFRLARQNGIRAIMSGNAMGTSPGLEGLSSACHYDRKYYLTIANSLLGRREREFYLNPPYVRTTIRRLLGIEAQVINVLDYLQPTLKEIHDRLDGIGWKHPADAIQHGDCLLDPLKEHLYYKRWGCTEVTSLYSLLIRNGEITREEALKKTLAEEHNEAPPILPEFLKAIGMTEDEFNEASKKDFRDIPNMRNTLIFRWGKRIVHTVERLRKRR